MGNIKAATVTFDEAVTVGGEEIKSIRVRTPTAGELRGCQITMLLQMDVGQLVTLLPRITVPSATTAEIEAMPPSALMAMSYEVLRFLTGGGE